MSNLSQVLKAEIVRLSRKEIKAFSKPIRGATVYLRKTVSELKKKIAVLEAENKRLLSYHKTSRQPQVPLEVAKKARVTSRGIRILRRKLGISQDALAQLLGVSSQAVYAMEHKQGRIRLRPATLSHLISVRGMGKREVKKTLEEIQKKK